MRLFLLPISTRRALIYCEPLAHTAPVSKQSYLDWVVNKANSTWLDWEKDEKAVLNWKRRTTDLGNKLFRRIPFEEWGLKSIPPLSKTGSDTQPANGKPISGGDGARAGMVDVSFPGLYQDLCTRSMANILKAIATERQALHRSRMIGSMVGMPLVAPIGLLPVVPNLPFFYLVFRAYSHWKALLGSRHLDYLIKNNRIRLAPSPALDSLYTAGLLHPTIAASRGATQPSMQDSRAVVTQLKAQTMPPSPTQSLGKQGSPTVSSSSSSSATAKTDSTALDEEVMLLRGWNAKLIAERLKLPGLEVEIERAVEQVENSIGKSKEEMQQEKLEIEQLAHRAESSAKKSKKA